MGGDGPAAGGRLTAPRDKSINLLRALPDARYGWSPDAS
jgi:hypothetical protein